ncbi:amino acid kinase family protein [Propionibacterium australiense]|nr:hypothetical protein [Propionibacterium australiense]SYZ33515.1 Amino acid kinase family [Propionibacterium australiense]VEH89650.1 gamma-glutamyl kinase [Propionibacterium australiense]
MTPRAPIVVKLGGSLISNTVANSAILLEERLADLCAQLPLDRPVFVAHGTGSFGKPAAIEFGYLDRMLSDDMGRVVSHVNQLLLELELAVYRQLELHGLNPFRISLLDWSHVPSAQMTRQLELLIMRGHTPVVGGGFIVTDIGYEVLSSDDIAVGAALALRASDVVFAINAPGVYDGTTPDHRVYESINVADLARLTGIPDMTGDCTGGIAAKLRVAARAASAGIRTLIVDGRAPQSLSDALAGRSFQGTELFSLTKDTACAVS